jgi:hypothetical protein
MENDVMYNIMEMLRGRYLGRKFPMTLCSLDYDDVSSIVDLMRSRFSDIAWTYHITDTSKGGELFLVWIDEDICLREQMFGWRN